MISGWRHVFFLTVLAAVVLHAAPVSAADARYLEDDAAIERVLSLVGQRLELMPAVAAVKWRSGGPIADPAREREVVSRAVNRALSFGLAGEPVAGLVELQMRFGREAQQRLHARWRERGFDFVATSPDLARELRPRIDGLTADLLRAIHLALPALTAPRLYERRTELASTRLGNLLTGPEREELLQALGGLRRAPAPVLARVRASGVLRIGTTGDYAPFSVEQGGSLSGADTELAQMLAAHLGVEAVFVRTSWPTLLGDLAADRYDLAISGISVTPERRRAGFFSRRYHEGGKVPIARCTESGRFDTLAEIDSPGVRVIVNPGGTNERYAREHLRAAALRVHADNRSVFDEIVAGRADVMITDDIEVELQTRRHPELCRTMPGTLMRSVKAVLMPRDRALRAAVDRWMQRQLAAAVPRSLLDAAMSSHRGGM